MISRSRRSGWFVPGIAGLACVVTAVTLAGCVAEDDQPQARVVAPPPPAAPPAPTVTPIKHLMAQLHIDERVELPEGKAPDNDADREAVLEIFDAFARGDAEVLGSMISLDDKIELEELVSSGTWRETVAGITRIEIQTGISPYDQKCALGIFHVGGEFQPQLWYYHYSPDDDGFIFDAAPTPPDIMDKLSGADWIAAWHQILVDELARADDPDEVIEVVQRNYDDEEAGGGGSGGQPGRRAPQAPPGGPKRRQPKPPRAPPGPF